ncbi:MAG: bifunctional oligoribonuclease/PAP phosphatase NrnA [Solobacterium sp.]|nr:bifunctional oligoribonuclease/PAP phosphatase NrnA [Solobacterium sp.]
MNFSDLLLHEIEAADIITIYRHVHPDCDAVGSQFGLFNWLKENWPEKQVYALGHETCTQGHWPDPDTVSDETIRNSLAIVLDTANTARIDDERAMTALKVIKIDHHPNREPFGDIQMVSDSSAATCEILTELLKGTAYPLSSTSARYFYAGILTDTLCFRTSNTTAHTLKMAAVLAEHEFSIPELNRELFDRTISEFEFASYLRSAVQFTEQRNMGYVILSQDELNRFRLKGSEARNYIDEIGHITELEVWCVFTERISEKGIYDGSLRSKHVSVNDIAERFHGGGHKNASGVKDLTQIDLKDIIQQLKSKAEGTV